MRALVILALGLGLILAGCQKAAEDEIDQEALDQIALTVEGELNAPPIAIVALLRTAGEQSQVGSDALSIGFDGQNQLIDWWLYRRGYVQMDGQLSVGRPAMGLTAKARAEVAAGEPAWFQAEVGDPERVDCSTPDAVSIAGCEVELPVTPTLTDAGKSAMGDITLPPFKLLALVAPSDEGGWTVTDYRTDGLSIVDIALTAILGPEDGRIAARQAAMEEINGRLAMTGEGQQAPTSPSDVVLPPIQDHAPVEAITGGRPLGLDVPTRGRAP